MQHFTYLEVLSEIKKKISFIPVSKENTQYERGMMIWEYWKIMWFFKTKDIQLYI